MFKTWKNFILLMNIKVRNSERVFDTDLTKTLISAIAISAVFSLPLQMPQGRPPTFFGKHLHLENI